MITEVKDGYVKTEKEHGITTIEFIILKVILCRENFLRLLPGPFIVKVSTPTQKLLF
jgi:hypothetical protein